MHFTATSIREKESVRVNSPSLLDPQDLVFMVAGMLYSSGHFPIRLDDQALRSAVPAAAELLRALGITPANPQRWNDER